MKRYKKRHIAFGVWIIIFKISVIVSLIYLANVMIDLRDELQLTREGQMAMENQLAENQASMQGQINEISDSLIIVRQDFDDEITQLKAKTSADFSEVIEDVIPGVVSIGTDISQGTGFIISDDGYVVTNAHVIAEGQFIRILNYESNNWIDAEFIGWDETFDIAVLKIPDQNYDSLKFADSDDIKVGEKTIALGNPLGLAFSVSEGIVSALHREGPNGMSVYIQVDTPLNRGNSGGPLVNKEGKVIGINNFKLQNSENLGFALESNSAVDSINGILNENNQELQL